VAAIRHGVLFLSQPVIRFLTEARASVSFILSQHADPFGIRQMLDDRGELRSNFGE
jgi:hypothetical protein